MPTSQGPSEDWSFALAIAAKTTIHRRWWKKERRQMVWFQGPYIKNVARDHQQIFRAFRSGCSSTSRHYDGEEGTNEGEGMKRWMGRDAYIRRQDDTKYFLLFMLCTSVDCRKIEVYCRKSDPRNCAHARRLRIGKISSSGKGQAEKGKNRAGRPRISRLKSAPCVASDGDAQSRCKEW